MHITPVSNRQWCWGKLRFLNPEAENIIRDGKILCTFECLRKFEARQEDCHASQLALPL